MATNIFNQQIDPYWHSANLAAQPGIQMLDTRTALLRDMTKAAARQLGYQDTGAMPPQELAALMQAVGASEGDRAAMMAQAPAAVTKNETQDDYLREQFGYQFQDKQILDWLTGQGYKVNTGRMGNYEGQQLVGPDGNIVSVDLYHDRSADKFADATKLAIAAMAAAGAPAMFGTEAGAGLGGAEAGGGLLGAGGGNTLAAAELSSLAPGAVNAGGYISQITPALSGLGEIAPMAGLGGGAAAGAGGLLSGGTSTLAPAQLSMTAPGAVGGSISGVSPAIGAGGLSPIAGIGGGGVAAGGAAGGGGSFGDFGTGFGGEWTADLGSLGQVGMGDVGSGAVDFLSGGGGKNLAALLGGLAGASEGGKPNTASSTSQLDPRMQAYLYGTGVGDKDSLLGAAQDWWKNNKSGMNDDMTAGLGRLRDLYSSPQYNQGYEQMRNMGQGLMNITPAGNPFTQGLLGMPGTNPGPNVGIRPPAPGVGLLSNFNPRGRG